MTVQRLLPVLAAMACAAGCGRDPYGLGKTVPLEGTVHVAGKPLTHDAKAFGKVWFYPDSGKGNKCPQVAVSEIDKEGRFKLFIGEKPGVPPGWYKVAVVATEQIDPHKPGKKRKSFVPAKYGDAETSGLRVEVKEETRELDLYLK